MEDANLRQYIESSIKNGDIIVKADGELEITEKGMKSGTMAFGTQSGRDYLKKVVKHMKGLGNKKIDKNTLIKNMQEIEGMKLNLLERMNISQNDDLIGYQVFYRLCEALAEHDGKDTKHKGFDGVLSILKESKYFQIPENVSFMLLNTKNKVSRVKLPHLYMFLDTTIVIYDRTYYGILLGDIDQLKEMGQKANIDVKDIEDKGILVTSFYDGGEGYGWSKFNLYEKDTNKYIKKLKEYIMNTLCFLNSDEIKIMLHERTEKNRQRRIENKRVPLPSFNKIQVIGYLAKYLEKLESEGGNIRFTHRFWVRGHFRHFWDKRYDTLYKSYKLGDLKHKEGKQYLMDSNTLKLWIYPYIKGQGILIEKKYQLV